MSPAPPALVWSRRCRSNSQVVDILLSSADRHGVGGIRLDSWTMHGGLNLHAALTYSVTRPVANAGADQTLTDNDDDGVEMRDARRQRLVRSQRQHRQLRVAGREPRRSAAGATLSCVSLPVGFHTVTLQVTDNDGEIGTDNVTIDGSSDASGHRDRANAAGDGGGAEPRRVQVQPDG